MENGKMDLDDVLKELRLWEAKGSSIVKLFKINQEEGSLSIEIPKYNNSGSFKLNGFTSYSDALGFFGSVIDKV